MYFLLFERLTSLTRTSPSNPVRHSWFLVAGPVNTSSRRSWLQLVLNRGVLLRIVTNFVTIAVNLDIDIEGGVSFKLVMKGFYNRQYIFLCIEDKHGIIQ